MCACRGHYGICQTASANEKGSTHWKPLRLEKVAIISAHTKFPQRPRLTSQPTHTFVVSDALYVHVRVVGSPEGISGHVGAVSKGKRARAKVANCRADELYRQACRHRIPKAGKPNAIAASSSVRRSSAMRAITSSYGFERRAVGPASTYTARARKCCRGGAPKMPRATCGKRALVCLQPPPPLCRPPPPHLPCPFPLRFLV